MVEVTPHGNFRELYEERLLEWDRNQADRCVEGSDSATLGWGEAYVLRAFVEAYRVTGNPYWLRRLCEHADTVIRNAKDTPEGESFDPVYSDGFLGWGTAKYSDQYDEYMVHDGHLCAPIAEFAGIALHDAVLWDAFGDDAMRYVAFIERHVVAKWLNIWERRRDPAEGFAWGETVRNWGGLDYIPHNQYAAFATLLLFLDDVIRSPRYSSVISVAGDTLHRRRAVEMGEYLRRHLTPIPEHDAYTWKYHDTCGPEDTSHSNLELEFAWLLHERGLVFSDVDMGRFARTLTKVMWDASLENPRINASTDGKGEWSGGQTVWGWALFAACDEIAREVLHHVCMREGSADRLSSLVATGRLLRQSFSGGVV
jgi:hypothetical protein